MKRLVQIAAMAVVALLAGQPVMEGLSCSLHMGRVACPMGMSEMGPDCPMPGQMAEAGCMPDCCNHARPEPAVLRAVPAKPRTGAAVQAIAAATGRLNMQAGFGPLPTRSAEANPPPRYLLNQVFRI